MTDKHTPTRKQREMVTAAAGASIPHRSISSSLGISLAELQDCYSFELRRGPAYARMVMLVGLYDAAIAGDVEAAEEYLRQTTPPQKRD